MRTATPLAEIDDLVAITGGLDGVAATFARAFSQARLARNAPERLYHLLPRDMGPRDAGVTLPAGDDFHERREILARVAQTYLVVEGGPGTEHEADVAMNRGAPVVPLARTGGCAGGLFARIKPPSWSSPSDWNLLADAAAPVDRVVAAVRRLVEASFDPSA